MHGITIDGKDNVWLAGNGGNTVLKFSKDGKFLLQIGKNGASKGNTDTANLSRPAEVEVDMAANEVYVADGYGNRRVIVYDADKGTFKRMWAPTASRRQTTRT
jgi:DNA-binding beta-propeller fold protein YncE